MPRNVIMALTCRKTFLLLIDKINKNILGIKKNPRYFLMACFPFKNKVRFTVADPDVQ